MSTADRLFRHSLEEELAAIKALDQPSPLTLAVLHRSAAWLALECGNPRLAQELASTALAHNPPPEVADELREVSAEAVSRQATETVPPRQPE